VKDQKKISVGAKKSISSEPQKEVTFSQKYEEPVTSSKIEENFNRVEEPVTSSFRIEETAIESNHTEENINEVKLLKSYQTEENLSEEEPLTSHKIEEPVTSSSIKENFNSQPPSISLESIESPAKATVALLINVSEKPLNLEQTSLPDNSFAKNFVAETRLNVSAVEIEEIEEPIYSRKISESSFSASSSVEVLNERERSVSVSSSSDSDSESVDYSPKLGNRFDVPEVTVTLEEQTPIIVVEDESESEPEIIESPILKTETLNRKNMADSSLTGSSNSGRNSYWSSQALQNDNAQTINEVILLFRVSIFYRCFFLGLLSKNGININLEKNML
jgi:hypothetical protein